MAPAKEYTTERIRNVAVLGHGGSGKTALIENFDIAYELETTMQERGKDLSVLEPTRFRPGDLISVRQQVPLGLGHAIWCARAIVGDEPFAILLPDELMIGRPGCMAQMVEAYAEVGGNLISVLEVPREEVSSYGVIDPGATEGALTEVRGLVEKPAVAEAPSNKIISGRYILQPEVMRTLDGQEKGAGGEIQLTDAMARMIGQQPFHAVTFEGRRFDCGSKAGFVEATLALALEREDIGGEVRRMAERLRARYAYGANEKGAELAPVSVRSGVSRRTRARPSPLRRARPKRRPACRGWDRRPLRPRALHSAGAARWSGRSCRHSR